MAAEVSPAAVADWQDDAHAHEGCYIFSPDSSSFQTGHRPAKRRKVSQKVHDVPNLGGEPSSLFRPLLNGAEKPGFVKLRRKLYEDGWGEQEDRFNSILHSLNAATLDEIASFVGRAASSDFDDRIPTGLVVAGPSIASHGLLFQQIADRIKADDHGPAVVLRSADATNLKSLLRLLIARATSPTVPDENDPQTARAAKGRKLLNYDLQILHEFVLKKRPRRVVVTFQDTEAFDSNVLVEVLTLLRSWLDRIPLVILFGIATSVEIFHQKFPSAAIRCLRGERFDVERSEESLERLFNDAARPNSLLRLGPALSGMLLDRQRDHVQSVEAFISAVKYSYMSHFFANPLSVFASSEPLAESLQPEHYEALRNLRSFRTYVEKTLNEGNTALVRRMLNENDSLLAHVLPSVGRCKERLFVCSDAVRVVHVVRAHTTAKSTIPRSELYIKAMSGEIHNSPLIRELLMAVKRMSSEKLSELLKDLTSLDSDVASLPPDFHVIQHDLVELLTNDSNNDKPLRSEHDAHHQGLRTTVVAQKVELSKRKSTLTEQESSYTSLVQQVHKTLSDYFSFTFDEKVQSIFCHELFVYDLKGSHRDVFAPKPRFAVERALSAPHDYLNCSCCAPGEALSATQPPTAILYQLYLESGPLINVFDLWSAFYTILGGEGGEDCDERNALYVTKPRYQSQLEPGLIKRESATDTIFRALFYRALAELRQMGIMKHSRKKTDHMSKLAWRGL